MKNIKLARILRTNMTDAERKLWRQLRLKQLGFRFRRQVPIGKYIADFVCHEVRLIIELDGGQHNEEKNSLYDQERTVWLTTQGYRVVRFWNNEVIEDIDAVMELILGLCHQRKLPPSFPSPTRGEGTY